MAGIDKYFSKKGRSRVKLFEKVSGGKKKKERRKIEEKLLKPYVIPEYSGKLPGYNNPIESRKVLMIFKSTTDLEIFKKYFKVSTYKGNNVRDLSLLILFLEALETGSIEYDKSKKEINFITEQGERIPL